MLPAASMATSLIGGAMGADASKNAANAQSEAAARQLALQKQMYEETVARNAPWLKSGMGANTKLSNMLGTGDNINAPGYGSMTNQFSMADYLNNQDPGYQFGMTQGQNALNAQNASTGGAQSGAAMKAAARYGQDYAGTKFNDAYNRWSNNRSNVYNMLSGQSAVGQNSANNTASAGNAYATGGGAAIGAGGAAAASGYMGAANSYNNAIGSAGNAMMNYNMMNKLFPTKPTSDGYNFGGGGTGYGDGGYQEQSIFDTYGNGQ